ncbi:MAG: hypothetical protein AAFX85_14100 [Pseudomonadota bacterium]
MSSSENTDPGRIRSADGQVYGIRMYLPATDSFVNILGNDQAMFRWYASEADRDRALREMRSEHLFSRAGDRPTLIYEPVEQPQPAGYTRRPDGPGTGT